MMATFRSSFSGRGAEGQGGDLGRRDRGVWVGLHAADHRLGELVADRTRGKMWTAEYRRSGTLY